MVLIPERYFIHLLGKTGTGKSSTGNTILGKKAFNCKSSTSAVTNKIQIESARLGQRTVQIVDGPGLVDVNTGLNDASMKALKQIVMEKEDSVHVFLMIWRYGDPLSTDDRAMVDALKKEFGSNVFRNHGIIAMTSGDNFRADTEDDEISFESWCEGQTGTFSEVLKKTRGRAFLIENSRPLAKRDEDALSTLSLMLDKLNTISASGMSLRKDAHPTFFASYMELLYKYRVPLIGMGLVAAIMLYCWSYYFFGYKTSNPLPFEKPIPEVRINPISDKQPEAVLKNVSDIAEKFAKESNPIV